MSVRLGISSSSALASASRTVEQVRHLVRSRARLRVALEAVDRLVGVLDALQRAVEERACVAFTLGGSVFSSTAKPWFWLVMKTRPLSRSCTGWLAPWWPNFIFTVLRARREAEELVAEADAEDRHAGADDARGSPRSRTRSGSGSPGPLERKTPSGFSASASFARGRRGQHGHLAAALGEVAQDVVLHAVVEGDDVELRGLRRPGSRCPAPRGCRSSRRACRCSRPWPGPGPPSRARRAPRRARPSRRARGRLAGRPARMQPFWAPLLRRRRVSRRVSMSAIATTRLRLR